MWRGRATTPPVVDFRRISGNFQLIHLFIQKTAFFAVLPFQRLLNAGQCKCLGEDGGGVCECGGRSTLLYYSRSKVLKSNAVYIQMYSSLYSLKIPHHPHFRESGGSSPHTCTLPRIGRSTVFGQSVQTYLNRMLSINAVNTRKLVSTKLDKSSHHLLSLIHGRYRASSSCNVAMLIYCSPFLAPKKGTSCPSRIVLNFRCNLKMTVFSRIFA